jgi:hypothetical protein
MFEIKEKAKLQVRLYGTDYQLNKPSTAEVKAFQAGLKDAKDGEVVIDSLRAFLAKLGLPEAAIDDMPLSDVKELAFWILGDQGKK